MIAAIAAARETVVLESYIFRSDETGQRFATALVDAVARGVAVRAPHRLDRHARHPLQLRRRPAEGRRRACACSTRPACARGSASCRATTASCSSSTPRSGSPAASASATSGWARRRATAATGATPPCASRGPPRATCSRRSTRCGSAPRSRSAAARIASRDASRAARTSIPPPPSRRSSASSRASRSACASRARSRCRPSPPSARSGSPTRTSSRAGRRSRRCIGAARDGVDVRILVPQRNDHPWVTLLTRRYYRRLLTNGVRIWEWKGAMMHAKTSVVDGRWVRVGSTDFNPLGVAINYELDAVIEDAGARRRRPRRCSWRISRSRRRSRCGAAWSATEVTQPRPARGLDTRTHHYDREITMTKRTYVLADRLETGAAHARRARELPHGFRVAVVTSAGRAQGSASSCITSPASTRSRSSSPGRWRRGNPIVGVTTQGCAAAQRRARHRARRRHEGSRDRLASSQQRGGGSRHPIADATTSSIRLHRLSLNGDAPLTCQFMLEDHAVRHSYHHLAAIAGGVESGARRRSVGDRCTSCGLRSGVLAPAGHRHDERSEPLVAAQRIEARFDP